MAKTEVILLHNIVGLGAESDHVKVAAGYARNYLLPQGLAIPVTAANKRRLEVLRQRRAEREAHDFNTMSELSKSVSKLVAVVTVKTGEDGKMFGAVTSAMIVEQLKSQFDVSLDKKKIHLEHPIRTLGEHEVELHLHPEISARLKVRVESSTPLPPPPEAPAEGKRQERRGDWRGRRGEGLEKGAKPVTGERGPRVARPERPRGDKTARPQKLQKPEPPQTEKKE